MSHALRLAAEAYLARHLRHGAPRPLPMWSLLPVPIQERLILLCLMDDAAALEIKACLPFAKEPDLRLQSDRMIEACAVVEHTVTHPFAWIDPEHRLEWQLTNIFYPALPALLFGPVVPAPIHDLGLKTRVIGYLRYVELMTIPAICQLLRCSEWRVKQAIKRLKEILL